MVNLKTRIGYKLGLFNGSLDIASKNVIFNKMNKNKYNTNNSCINTPLSKKEVYPIFLKELEGVRQLIFK